jgi:hypothetical protein
MSVEETYVETSRQIVLNNFMAALTNLQEAAQQAMLHPDSHHFIDYHDMLNKACLEIGETIDSEDTMRFRKPEEKNR